MVENYYLHCVLHLVDYLSCMYAFSLYGNSLSSHIQRDTEYHKQLCVWCDSIISECILLYVYAYVEADHALVVSAIWSAHQLGSPDVVVLAEDHASFAVAGAAVLAQLSVAAGALEAARMPILFHREEQEAVCNPTSTSCTRPACCPPSTAHHCHCGHLHPAVHHSNL